MLTAVLAVFVLGAIQDTAIGHAFIVAFRYCEFIFFSVTPGDGICEGTGGTANCSG